MQKHNRVTNAILVLSGVFGAAVAGYGTSEFIEAAEKFDKREPSFQQMPVLGDLLANGTYALAGTTLVLIAAGGGLAQVSQRRDKKKPQGPAQ